LRPALAICFVDTPLFSDLADFHLAFELRERHRKVLFTDYLAVHILELPRFKKTVEELQSSLDRWLYCFEAGRRCAMATVLVVDDSTVDRRLAGRLLEKQLEVKVAYAKDGKAAIKALEKEPPDIVLTDLHMPNMNGLELVEYIRGNHSSVPVILMTAYGSEEIAVQALQRGAASYVPKRLLAENLASTVESLLDLARRDRAQGKLLDCLTEIEAKFVLQNDPGLIAPLIGHIETSLRQMNLCDGTGLIRITVALREAILNAMDGNLEVNSGLREQDEAAYHRVVKEHSQQDPYRVRRVHVTTQELRDRAVFVVRHEGPAADFSSLPDLADPGNLEKLSSRGLLLMRTFMDDVSYDDSGRELTMIKHSDFAQSPSDAPELAASEDS
jgi:CheY-like chemotaxis protein